MSNPDILGSKIPITGIAGDQQVIAYRASMLQSRNGKINIWNWLFCFIKYGANIVFLAKMLTTIAYGINGQVSMR